VGFNAPMVRYAAAGDADNGRAAVRELKQLIKDCHTAGLEVCPAASTRRRRWCVCVCELALGGTSTRVRKRLWVITACT
jgi:hypothetical protein